MNIFAFSSQDVLKVCMESNAIRNVIALITDDAIVPMGRVCVTRDCTDASATCVSISSSSASSFSSFSSFLQWLYLVWVQYRTELFVINFIFNAGFVSFSVACPKWVFGPGCSEECKCVQENTLECHRRHGSCSCKPGYHGDKCEKGPSRTENHGRVMKILYFLCLL